MVKNVHEEELRLLRQQRTKLEGLLSQIQKMSDGQVYMISGQAKNVVDLAHILLKRFTGEALYEFSIGEYAMTLMMRMPGKLDPPSIILLTQKKSQVISRYAEEVTYEYTQDFSVNFQELRAIFQRFIHALGKYDLRYDYEKKYSKNQPSLFCALIRDRSETMKKHIPAWSKQFLSDAKSYIEVGDVRSLKKLIRQTLIIFERDFIPEAIPIFRADARKMVAEAELKKMLLEIKTNKAKNLNKKPNPQKAINPRRPVKIQKEEFNSRIVEIIDNSEGLYEGNLRYYFKLVFDAPNANNPYHNFRHMLHVLCNAYVAGVFCRFTTIFGKRRFRALLIAAVLHDYGHSGKMGNDSLEIEILLNKFDSLILYEDRDLIPFIRDFISSTKFPYENTVISLGSEILRDADMSQTLTSVWIQQIIFGLAAEREISPLQSLKGQITYLRSMKFYSPWGKKVLIRRVYGKIKETEEFLSLLK